jgi:hypothetical protein
MVTLEHSVYKKIAGEIIRWNEALKSALEIATSLTQVVE